MLNQRLRQYRDRMGFTQDTMAGILDIPRDTYLNYERLKVKGKAKKITQLPLDQVTGIADRLLVSLDWIAGKQTDMWSEPLLRSMRASLRVHIKEKSVQRTYYYERICDLLRWTYNSDKERFTSTLLAGIADVKPIGRMDDILHNNLNFPLNNATPDLLGDFWQLRARWLRSGKESPFIEEPAALTPILRLIEEIGLTGEFLSHHEKILVDLQSDWMKNGTGQLLRPASNAEGAPD